MNSLLDLWRGIIRHPLQFVAYAFTAFSVIYTLMKGLTLFVPGITIEGPIALTAVVFICVCYGLKQVWKPSKITLQIAHTNTVLEVLVGDLFTQKGIRVISVNEFFDSKLGKPVSEKSLHGMFIQKSFGGRPESLDAQLEEELKNLGGVSVTKSEGKTKSYPIGTTAMISVNQDGYLLFALTKTDPVTLKASASVTMMWDALHRLWQRARVELGGRDLNLPLVGSGLSGLGLPTRDLLNLIILSAITETKTNEVTQRIRIVLHRDRFDDLDLRDVRKHWEEK
jgi:hypothetical protein